MKDLIEFVRKELSKCEGYEKLSNDEKTLLLALACSLACSVAIDKLGELGFLKDVGSN